MNFDKGIINTFKDNYSQNTNFKYMANFIMVIIVIIIIIWLISTINNYGKKNPILIDRVRNAKKPLTIKSKKLKFSKLTDEYTYSFWIYIQDWGYRLNKPKCILYKGDKNGREANPTIWLYPHTNKLMVRVKTYPSKVKNMHLYPNNPNRSMNPLNNSNMLSKPNSEEVQYVCDVPNIAIQRWVQVGVVLQNRTLDVYINGKLARSGILQGIPKMNKGNLYVTQYGGYDGYISCLQVFENAISANEMYNIYTGGPSGCKGWFKSNYFDKYRLKASIGKVGNLEDEQSISIKL